MYFCVIRLALMPLLHPRRAGMLDPCTSYPHTCTNGRPLMTPQSQFQLAYTSILDRHSLCVSCKRFLLLTSGVRKRKRKKTQVGGASQPSGGADKRGKHELTDDERKFRFFKDQRLPDDKLKRRINRLVNAGNASIEAYSKMSGNHAFWAYMKDDRLHIHGSLGAALDLLHKHELELTLAAANEPVWEGPAVPSEVCAPITCHAGSSWTLPCCFPEHNLPRVVRAHASPL